MPCLSHLHNINDGFYAVLTRTGNAPIMSKPGRPTFQINGELLRALRVRAGLSQRRMTAEVYTFRGKLCGGQETTAAQERHYQRVEQLGKTSPELAGAIAGVLAERLGEQPQRLLQTLRGEATPDPGDPVPRIRAQLARQHASGTNTRLEALLESEADVEQALNTLAQDVAHQLEVAYLPHDPERLADLAALTGCEMQDLCAPINLVGYWLVVSHMGIWRSAMIHLGLVDAIAQIKEEITRWFHPSESRPSRGYRGTARLRMSEDGSWLRVRLEHSPSHSLSHSFSLVRCAPSAVGLSWVKPDLWDRFWIEQFESWTFTQANFVKPLEGESIRPTDLTRLRLAIRLVTDTVPATDVARRQRIVHVHRGSIADVHPSTMESAMRDWSAYAEIIKALAAGLREVLKGLLPARSHQEWTIGAQSDGIRLGDAMGRDGEHYMIELTEQVSDEELRKAPWSLESKCQIIAALRPDLPNVREVSRPSVRNANC